MQVNNDIVLNQLNQNFYESNQLNDSLECENKSSKSNETNVEDESNHLSQLIKVKITSANIIDTFKISSLFWLFIYLMQLTQKSADS